MTKLLILTLVSAIIFCTPQETVGQILGNYKRSQPANARIESEPFQQNNMVFNQYRSVAKAASIQSPNSFEISINALSNQRASSYMAIFNIIQIGETAEKTNTALSNRLNLLMADLKSLGIQDDDLYVDLVNFLPKYEYDVSKKLFSKKTYKEIPIGFELQKNLHVRFNSPEMLDDILTAAAKQEVYDIVKVDYFVDDPKAIYQELRDAAFDYLVEIKTQYKEIGIELDSAYIVTGENAWVANPGDRYQNYKGFSAQMISPQQRADSKVDQIDKPETRFYDAIAANDYDIVINPEILEPAIQFSYNLLVRFTLPERIPTTKTVREKEFIMVTPEGVVKTLKIESTNE